MADPGDTAALCNDTKAPYIGSTEQKPGQPAEPDIEAGSVIGEEPRASDPVLGEGEEGVEDGEDNKSASQKSKADSKVPFIYLIVDPGCTPLSCYSAIITFIIMTCGVLWLLLISPPFNQNGNTVVKLIKTPGEGNSTISTFQRVVDGVQVVSGKAASKLLEELTKRVNSTFLSSEDPSLDPDEQPPNLT